MKKFFRKVFVGLFLLLFWPYFLYKKYGNTDYKLGGKTIIISNHYSTFDAFFIYLIYYKQKIHFVTIAEAKKRYLSRFVTSLFDCLYIEDNICNFKFFKQCINILNDNGILCIFPEGIINPRKFGFFDFKNSFIYFARKTGAQILPIYIYPELDLFKKSTVYIGDIIDIDIISAFKTNDEASAFIQSKIIEYSNIINK